MSPSDPLLTDTHCHLSLEELAPARDELIARARSTGVHRMVVPGIDLDTSRAAVKLAEREPGIFAAVGIHPHDAEQWSSEARAEIRQLAGSQAVVAIGEIGLDYFRDYAPRDRQRQALRGQLELAGELGKPVILHNREATQDLLDLLIEWAAGLSPDRKLHAGVLHAFSGGTQDAEAAIHSGFYIGVAGPVTFPNAAPLRDTLKALPTERMLIETDTPYLAPQPRRGQRNEPAYLPYIAAGLAQTLGVDTTTAAAATSRNAAELFGLDDGNQDPYLH